MTWSTDDIERRRISETGVDAVAVDCQSIQGIESIARRVELEGADANPAERRN